MSSRNAKEKSHSSPGIRGWERLIKIDQLIRDRRYPNARDLAEMFGVSERTIYGDHAYLRDHLGAPVKHDSARNGWFYMESNFALPTIFLSEGDMLAVFIGIEVAERYAGTPYESMLKNALDKIARSYPDMVSLQLNQFASFATPPSLTVDEIKLNQLYTAMRHLHPVKMTYFTASNGKTSQRQVDPYHLRHFNGEWYLIALDSNRGEVRIFNVGRIKELHALTHLIFKRPTNFDASKWLQNSFGIECDEKIHQVRIRFDAAQAHYIRERRWHSQQTIKDTADGGLILQFPASGLGEVLRWVMRYGGHAEVLQPAALRKMARREAQAMCELYADEK
jgi:predicted DNA-binding transcriptional regulator YafY